LLDGELDDEEVEGGLDGYLEDIDKESKAESAVENVLNGLKEASEIDDVDKEGVGNFLQKLEAKVTTGLLEAKEELSEFADKSGVDSILDSGNFCNDDASPYNEMHSRNHSGVPFEDRFD
jgi:hypothetical protein